MEGVWLISGWHRTIQVLLTASLPWKSLMHVPGDLPLLTKTIVAPKGKSTIIDGVDGATPGI